MKSRCITTANSSQVRNNNFDAYMNDLNDFAKNTVGAVKEVLGNQPLDRIASRYKAVETTDQLVKELTGIESMEKLSNAPEVVKINFSEKMEALLSQLNLAKSDYSHFVEDVATGSGFDRYIKQMHAIKFVERKISNAFLFGKAANNIRFDMLSNKQLLFKHHDISKQLYAEYHMFDNSLKNGIEHFTNEFRLMLSNAHKVLGLKVSTISELMTYFDNRYKGGMDDLRTKIMNAETHDIKRYFSKESKANPSAGKLDIANLLINNMRTAVIGKWNELNYGIADINNYDTKEDWKKYTASYAHFQHTMNERLSGILGTGENTHSMLAKRLGQWELRKGYVPNKQLSDDPYSRLIDREDVQAGSIPSFLKTRKDNITNSSSAFDIFEQNMLAMSFVFTNIGQRAMAEGMKNAMDQEQDTKWADDNPEAYTTIKFFSNSVIEYLDKKPDMSAATESVRNIAMVFTGSIATILAMPRSAVTNLIGGFAGILSTFGLKNFIGMRTDFLNAEHSDDPEVKMMRDSVMKNTISDFANAGKMHEFIKTDTTVSKNTNNLAVQITQAVRDKAHKLYDYSTGKGILGFIPFYQRIFSMKGSENILRMQAGSIMFKKVQNEVAAMKYANAFPDTESGKQATIQKIINENKVDLFYKMNDALGDFNKLNRPIWQWAMLKNPDSVGEVMLGASANLWSAFRTVQMLTLNFMSKVSVKAGFEFKSANPETFTHEGANRFDYMYSFAGNLLIIMLDLLAFTAGYKSIKSSMLTNINPLQEASSITKGTIGLFALNTNAIVSEEVADEGIKMAIGLAGGLLGSAYLTDIYDQWRDNTEGIDPLRGLKQIKKIFDPAIVTAELHKGVSIKEYYELVGKLREPMNNPIPLFNYTNSYLRFGADLLNLSPFIQGATEQDTMRIKSAQKNTLNRFIAAGVLGSFRNQWVKSENMYYNNYRVRNLVYKLMSEKKYNSNNGLTTVTQDKMLYQIENYGKIYMNSILGT